MEFRGKVYTLSVKVLSPKVTIRSMGPRSMYDHDAFCIM